MAMILKRFYTLAAKLHYFYHLQNSIFVPNVPALIIFIEDVYAIFFITAISFSPCFPHLPPLKCIGAHRLVNLK